MYCLNIVLKADRDDIRSSPPTPTTLEPYDEFDSSPNDELDLEIVSLQPEELENGEEELPQL